MEGEIEARVARPSVISNFSGETTGPNDDVQDYETVTHDSNLLLLLPKNPTRLEIRARTLSNLFDMKKLNEKAGLGLLNSLDSCSLGPIFYAQFPRSFCKREQWRDRPTVTASHTSRRILRRQKLFKS